MKKENKSARISTRIDPSLKDETEKILDNLGITPTEAINMYYKQILLNGGIPFEIKLPVDTLEAIRNVEEGKNLTTYDSKDDLFEELGIDVNSSS
jgi:DNA-damage-inducible protein J